MDGTVGKNNRIIRLKNLTKKFIWITAVIILMCLILARIAGIYPFVVMSGSMEPAIPVGSVCFVNTNALYEDIEAGDVIAYKIRESIMVTHRVIEKNADGFITKGDANKVRDAGCVNENHYVGKTIFFIPIAGYFLEYLKNPLNFIMIIIVLPCLNRILRHIMF